MHFRRPPQGGKWNDDFGLTFATRGSGSFPLAFPPINYDTVVQAFCSAESQAPIPCIEKFTRDHFAEHRRFNFPTQRAWMFDGGVLDNKPFSYVARAIERKPAEYEVFRAVVYVEPDPKGDPKPPNDDSMPGLLKVAGSLYKLFRHEPIYEDLRGLRDRKAKVKDIRALLDANRENACRAAVEAGRTAGLADPPAPKEVDKWRSAGNAHAAKGALSGYPGYVVLKASAVGGVLANVICKALEYPYASRQAFCLRHVVLAWLDDEGALSSPGYDEAKGYELNPEQRDLLKAFDVPFRLRRIRALVHAINETYGKVGNTEEPQDIQRNDLDKFKAVLAKSAVALQSLEEDVAAAREAIKDIADGAWNSAIDQEIQNNDFDPSCFIEKYGGQLGKVRKRLSEKNQGISDNADAEVMKALQKLLEKDNTEGKKATKCIWKAFITFPFVDLIAFPLMSAAGIEDLIDIKVMRISPYDVPELQSGRCELKSLGLGGFQGFLDQDAREHDMTWGRLDGAYRLVELLMKAMVGDELRDNAEADRIRRCYLSRLKNKILSCQVMRCY